MYSVLMTDIPSSIYFSYIPVCQTYLKTNLFLLTKVCTYIVTSITQPQAAHLLNYQTYMRTSFRFFPFFLEIRILFCESQSSFFISSWSKLIQRLLNCIFSYVAWPVYSIVPSTSLILQMVNFLSIPWRILVKYVDLIMITAMIMSCCWWSWWRWCLF